MKVTLEVPADLIKFFQQHVDDTEPAEILLVKMLRLLREMLKIANNI